MVARGSAAVSGGMIRGPVRLRRIAVSMLAALGLASGACDLSPGSDRSADCHIDGTIPGSLDGDGIVRIDSEGRFVVAETRFVPRGIGSYPLLEHAGNHRLAELDDILSQATELGRPLVRTGAFFIGGENRARIYDADGSLREEGLLALDRVLVRARAHGVRLILTLSNHWPDYGGADGVLGAIAPGEALPREAFYSDPRALAFQRQHLQVLAARSNALDGTVYALDPTIFAWELVNEARCEDPGFCDGETLVSWARVMSWTLRDAGVAQLIAWGGSGHLGEHGEDLAHIAAAGDVDILTLHVYPFASHPVAAATGAGIEGSGASRVTLAVALGRAAIAERSAIARAHRMPLLVEELGHRPPPGASEDDERAVVLGAWLREARRQGVAALPWMIAERGRPSYDGLLIRPEAHPATAEALRCE